MASRKIEDLHSALQPICKAFLEECGSAGVNAFITHTYRSDDEQNALYAQGRTKPGRKVTNAKAGQSAHNFTVAGIPASKAFDIAIKNDDGSLNWDTAHEDWRKAGMIGVALGLNWGGAWKSFKDYPHFELKDE
jgi:peptidoglycan L-alanyl-D-glutamate endopeptidase CwlK